MTPYFYTVWIMGKWLRYDGPENRLKLYRAFIVSLVEQTLRALWAIIGSYIVFGKLLPEYLATTFPQNYKDFIEDYS